ncbi:NPCBM/NEW2 domain-containing protein [Kitasatospora sp. NPDC094019]|uniref:NPCBM/NEW2 domain-containing protein n=1 Tax=Kitasatospora sp. NPDC094019 TaxID=3364091 RepID=UPI00380F299F
MPAPRRLGEVAALVSAGTAVVGLMLGFLGLPAVVDSPTAKTVRTTETVLVTTTETVRPTATVTVTASPTAARPSDTPGSGSPAPLPTGEVALRDLRPVGGPFADQGLQLRSVTMGGKTYPNSMVFHYPCQGGYEYSINQHYKSLTLIAGIDDNGVAEHGKLSIKGDGKEIKNVMLEINNPQTVTVDLTGVAKLDVGTDFDTDRSCDGIVPALADAVLHP